jgi:hypothetical protein
MGNNLFGQSEMIPMVKYRVSQLEIIYTYKREISKVEIVTKCCNYTSMLQICDISKSLQNDLFFEIIFLV